MVFRSLVSALSAGVLLSVSPGSAAQAEPPVLSLPVDCDVGIPGPTGCWLQTLVDHDRGPAVKDFTCGARSYNAENRFGQAHQGTDIGVLDWAAGIERVTVLAAAPGEVIRLRDGVADRRTFRGQASAETRRRACGNAVILDHGDGWETQYCHLREGSVRVEVGDTVARGEPLGLVGVSGLTSHPHLHFQVSRRVGREIIPVDPFDGTLLTESCDAIGAPLWDAAALKALTYRPVELIKLGFTIGEVNDQTLLTTLRPGEIIQWSTEDTVMAFAYFAGSHPGDVARIVVRDPNGSVVLSGERPTSHYRTRQFVAGPVSKARRFTGVAGIYRLDLQVMGADGVILARHSATARLSARD